MNTFRKQLERTGMTKEFENWMKSPLKSGFHIGDRVQVINVRKGDEDYYTMGGKGTIVNTGIGSIDDFLIRFDKKSSLVFLTDEWYVDPKDIKRI